MVTLLPLLLACDGSGSADNGAPEVQITEPADGATFHEGEPFTAVASVADDQGGGALVLTWGLSPESEYVANEFRSDEEISLFFSEGLPIGSFELSLLAVDEYQEAEKTSIELTIDENNPPTVRIEEPQDGAQYAVGESVGVSVVVKKRDDDMSNITLTWGGAAEGYPDAPSRPNADGAAIFYITDLDRGGHDLSVTASDGVHEASESVSFRVR